MPERRAHFDIFSWHKLAFFLGENTKARGGIAVATVTSAEGFAARKMWFVTETNIEMDSTHKE